MTAGSVLGSVEEIATERRVMRLVMDPRVQASVASVRAWMLTDKVTTADSKLNLDNALLVSLYELAMRKAGEDYSRPLLLWLMNEIPRTWHGYTFPGTGMGGISNPDNVYRYATVWGGYTYEVRARRAKTRPVQFSIEAGRTTSRRKAAAGQGFVDLGTQVAMLRDVDIDWDKNDECIFIFGPGDPSARKNYVQLPKESCRLLFRDTFSDWRQKPSKLSIRRIDPAPEEPKLTDEIIIQRIAQGFRGWMETWSFYRENWLGHPADNTLAGPLSRDGGWGLLAGGWYRLKDDEALLLNVIDGGAAYLGFQTTDSWMQAPDARVTFSSRNISQVSRDADGSITYVVAPNDPGYANWVGTGGSHDGLVCIRWQQFTKVHEKPSALLRSTRVVKFSDLEATLPSAHKVAPHQRAAELAMRQKEFDLRLLARSSFVRANA